MNIADLTNDALDTALATALDAARVAGLDSTERVDALFAERGRRIRAAHAALATDALERVTVRLTSTGGFWLERLAEGCWCEALEAGELEVETFKTFTRLTLTRQLAGELALEAGEEAAHGLAYRVEAQSFCETDSELAFAERAARRSVDTMIAALEAVAA